MTPLSTLIVRERHGIARAGEAIRLGVPLARGALADAAQAGLFDVNGQALPAQFRVLGQWPDRSVKWLLVDACVDMNANSERQLSLRPVTAAQAVRGIEVQESDERIRIDTGRAQFELPRAGSVLAAVTVDGRACLDAHGLVVRATGARGAALAVRILASVVEERGPVRTTVACSGVIESGGREHARLKLRLVFVRDSAAVRIECELWNPRAARHAGGLWDLGDAGSVQLADLSIELRPAQSPQRLDWQPEPGAWREASATSWSLYQDSSGGERWNSPNHVAANGKLTVSFRGYRVRGEGGELLAEGERASPALRLTGPAGSIGASVERFWQNFPKALRWHGGVLGIGLFPSECGAGFELQGGEKKRHAVLVEFGRDTASGLAALHAPLAMSLDPQQSSASGAVGYLLPARDDVNAGYLDYVGSIVEGPHSFLAKREIIDEYGWRNFGDLYADHEAVHHRGPEPFISHYNNQYDFVYGAGMHFLRTGEERWRELMVDAARHLLDIDIYHTRADKAGFSGGLFWHTDHYQPAATCTHRTYSRSNARGPYGGGPSNEHDYSSGLLQYHYLTGDPEAADAILELADWVMAMDDGSRTLLGFIDDGPTGLASKSRDADFHKPGRGAGNSINTLLDAYAISRQRRYLQFAESLIQRVIHPHDDVPALGLDAPETRWSYVVFLQVLGKYLDQKLEWGETDYLFWYARAGLLTYARWMLAHERPYKDVLHKVELPTETWPAHDIRKCHVFHAAARHAPAPERAAFTEKAGFYFERCLSDLLSFPTAHVTRPQVILCVYGVVHGYYRHDPHYAQLPAEPGYDFGAPVPFVTQGARLKGTLRRKLAVTKRELWRLVGDRLRGLFGRRS
jgi:exo-rhamnogalacturonan lyase-like protein